MFFWQIFSVIIMFLLSGVITGFLYDRKKNEFNCITIIFILTMSIPFALGIFIILSQPTSRQLLEPFLRPFIYTLTTFFIYYLGTFLGRHDFRLIKRCLSIEKSTIIMPHDPA